MYLLVGKRIIVEGRKGNPIRFLVYLGRKRIENGRKEAIGNSFPHFESYPRVNWSLRGKEKKKSDEKFGLTLYISGITKSMGQFHIFLLFSLLHTLFSTQNTKISCALRLCLIEPRKKGKRKEYWGREEKRFSFFYFLENNV